MFFMSINKASGEDVKFSCVVWKPEGGLNLCYVNVILRSTELCVHCNVGQIETILFCIPEDSLLIPASTPCKLAERCRICRQSVLLTAGRAALLVPQSSLLDRLNFTVSDEYTIGECSEIGCWGKQEDDVVGERGKLHTEKLHDL
jgi:hypothetical protein